MALDELDVRLTTLLQEDARRTNRELAQILGIAEATARSRLKRLEATGALRVLALTDIAAEGNDFLVMLMIRVEGRSAEAVAAEVAAIAGALTVTIVTGGCDIFASFVGSDREHVITLLMEQVGAIVGTGNIRSLLALNSFVSKPIWEFAGFESSTRRPRPANR